MKKKDKMLKKFYRTRKEVVYQRIIEDIGKDMAKSFTGSKYVIRGNKEEREFVINQLKADGFSVVSEMYDSNEERIRVKWL